MYVVTGGTGNTGRAVAKALLAKGHKVRAVGRSADRLQSLVQAGAEAFVAELTDKQALARAFSGASAVYVMIPPSLASDDPRGFQDRVSEATADALEKAKVAFAVSLSSLGADKADGAGPVSGLYYFEQQLNQVKGLNVLHLRPAYFMQNTLAQVAVIKACGFCAGTIRAGVRLPMIDAGDIGPVAAEELLTLAFKGQQTRELHGQRDLTYAEVATIIGKAIAKPEMVYRQLPDDQVRQGMVQAGLSPAMADSLLELHAALNSGHVRALESRSPRSTTPTSYEMFTAQEFVPAYEGKPRAA